MMNKPVAKPAYDVLAAIDRTNPIESRGSLSRWMRQNHDAFLARFENERPDWKALAKVFADAGLLDRLGKPASPDTARAAWARVRKSVSDSRKRRTQMLEEEPAPLPQPPQRPTIQIQRPPIPSPTPIPAPDPASQGPTRRRFEISRPRPPKDETAE